MALPKPLITAEQLRNALGFNTYMALFDEGSADGGTSGDVTLVDASPAVLLTLQRAHARVISRLAVIYQKIPDGDDATISTLLQDAELNFAIGIAYDRHPEYVNRFGWDPVRKGAYQMATETMELIQDTVMRIAPNDSPPEPKPSNAGGLVPDSGNQVFLPRADGTNEHSDW